MHVAATSQSARCASSLTKLKRSASFARLAGCPGHSTCATSRREQAKSQFGNGSPIRASSARRKRKSKARLCATKTGRPRVAEMSDTNSTRSGQTCAKVGESCIIWFVMPCTRVAARGILTPTGWMSEAKLYTADVGAVIGSSWRAISTRLFFSEERPVVSVSHTNIGRPFARGAARGGAHCEVLRWVRDIVRGRKQAKGRRGS